MATAELNNAPIQVCKPLVETTPQEWDGVMGVNLRSVYLAVPYLYPLMGGGGGAVVNVSSVHAVATSANVNPNSDRQITDATLGGKCHIFLKKSYMEVFNRKSY